MFVLPLIKNYLKKFEKPYEIVYPLNEVKWMYSLRVLAIIIDWKWRQGFKELDVRVHSKNFYKDREEFLTFIRQRVINLLEKKNFIKTEDVEKIKEWNWLYLEPVIFWRKWPLKIWVSESKELDEFNFTCEALVKNKKSEIEIIDIYDIFCVNPSISNKWKPIIFMDDIETQVVDRLYSNWYNIYDDAKLLNIKIINMSKVSKSN